MLPTEQANPRGLLVDCIAAAGYEHLATSVVDAVKKSFLYGAVARDLSGRTHLRINRDRRNDFHQNKSSHSTDDRRSIDRKIDEGGKYRSQFIKPKTLY